MTAVEYLKAIRGLGLTQAQVSERTGIPQPTISKIERGQVEDVLSKTYLRLKALHDDLIAVAHSRSSASHPRRRASDRLN